MCLTNRAAAQLANVGGCLGAIDEADRYPARLQAVPQEALHKRLLVADIKEHLRRSPGSQGPLAPSPIPEAGRGQQGGGE